VSDYGLDDRAIGVRSPAGAKDFSCILRVQTGSGAHPASCTMGTGGPFPGDKSAAGAWRWPLTPSSAEVENEELYLLSPQAPPWRVPGLLLPTGWCCLFQEPHETEVWYLYVVRGTQLPFQATTVATSAFSPFSVNEEVSTAGSSEHG
jgi:hypothetical protein